MRRPLSEDEYIERARPYEADVFGDAAALTPFTPAIRQRAVVFPVLYRWDTDRLFGAFTEALKRLGESSFFLTYVERPSLDDPPEVHAAWRDTVFHWELDSASEEDYEVASALGLENVLYSRTGAWGVQFSELGHALVGGPSDFVNAFHDLLPEEMLDTVAFARWWKEHEQKSGVHTHWVPDLLRHVNIAGAAADENVR